MDRVIPIVKKSGKEPIGWHQIVEANPPPSVLAQYWDLGRQAHEVAVAAQKGKDLIRSPANHAYLDMEYDENTELGLSWAGYTSVEDCYSWDPWFLHRRGGRVFSARTRDGPVVGDPGDHRRH